MPEDPHLFKGEGERFRRYARFCVDPMKRTLQVFEHSPFFQAKKFDVLYGDIHREFSPMTAIQFENEFFLRLLKNGYQALPILSSHKFEKYEISAHMIRIQASPHSLKGRPAPEGIHRDGYHFGSIHLMKRENVDGAENQIYDLQRKLIDQKVLADPMDSIFFDDAAILHAVTPFSQVDAERKATRDMLILLYQPLRESPQDPHAKAWAISSLDSFD